jgi:hypothetical protein
MMCCVACQRESTPFEMASLEARIQALEDGSTATIRALEGALARAELEAERAKTAEKDAIIVSLEAQLGICQRCVILVATFSLCTPLEP